MRSITQSIREFYNALLIPRISSDIVDQSRVWYDTLKTEVIDPLKYRFQMFLWALQLKDSDLPIVSQYGKYLKMVVALEEAMAISTPNAFVIMATASSQKGVRFAKEMKKTNSTMTSSPFVKMNN